MGVRVGGQANLRYEQSTRCGEGLGGAGALCRRMAARAGRADRLCELSEPLVGVTVPAGVLLILGGRLGSRNTPPDRRRQLSVGDRIRPLGAVFAGLIWIAMGVVGLATM